MCMCVTQYNKEAIFNHTLQSVIIDQFAETCANQAKKRSAHQNDSGGRRHTTKSDNKSKINI